MDQGQQVGVERLGARRRRRARGQKTKSSGFFEMRVTITDHVINHSLSFREASLTVQPNLLCSAVTGFQP